MGCGCSGNKAKTRAIQNNRNLKVNERGLSREIITTESRIERLRQNDPESFIRVVYHNGKSFGHALSFGKGLFRHGIKHYTSLRFQGDLELWMLKVDADKAPKNKITIVPVVERELKVEIVEEEVDEIVEEEVDEIVEEEVEEIVEEEVDEIVEEEVEEIVEEEKPKRKYKRKQKVVKD